MSSSDDDSLSFVAASFAQYESALRRFVRSRLPSDEALDDVVQEVWRRLLRAKIQCPIEKPLAYLFTTAKSVVADYYVRARRDSVCASAGDVEQELEGSEDTSNDPTFDQVCSLQMLEAILARMPRHYAQILVLRLARNLSYREIGEKMGFTTQTTERYFFAALRRAREIRTDFDATASGASSDRTGNVREGK